MAKYQVLKRGNFGYHVFPGDIVEDPPGVNILIQRGFVILTHPAAEVTASLDIAESRREAIAAARESAAQEAPPAKTEEGEGEESDESSAETDEQSTDSAEASSGSTSPTEDASGTTSQESTAPAAPTKKKTTA